MEDLAKMADQEQIESTGNGKRKKWTRADDHG